MPRTTALRKSTTAGSLRALARRAAGTSRGGRLPFRPCSSGLWARTGLKVSRLGPRHDDLGRRHRRARGARPADAFLEAGGTLVDTAAGYGDGASEELLGTLLGDVVARDDVVHRHQGRASRAGRGERGTDTSRGNLLATLDALAAAARGRPRRPVAGAHLGRRHPDRGDAGARSTTRSSTGRAAYVGISNYTGWQTAPGRDLAARRARAGRRWPPPRSSTPCSTARSSTRCCRPRRRSGSACCPGRRWAAACSPASTAPARRRTRAAPRTHFASFVGRLPRRPGPRHRRGGRPGRRRARLDAARGRPGLGARPARGHRADRGRPHRRPAAGRAGGRGR